jgi:hypothetical protein
MCPYHLARRSFHVLFAVLLPACCLAAGERPADVPVSGLELRQFDIYREGRHIGTHTISHSHRGDLLVVEARTRISVRLLGFEFYRFEYDARESWDEHGLLQLVASVDDDGQKASLDGQRQGDRFVWSDGETTRSHAMPVYPTNHWNIGVLGQEAVLNTLTGEINSVTIHDEGEESLVLTDSSLPATRYRYDGQLQLESWYDRAGRWLAMRFTVDDGSTIHYRCSNCTAQARL